MKKPTKKNFSSKSTRPKRDMHFATRAPKKSFPETTIVKPEFPMRINKYLARAGYATRRDADALVEKGLVLINGAKAVLGTKVSEEDKVEVVQKGKQKEYIYYAYHKPIGVVTHSPQLGELDVVQSSGLQGVFPVGRLDKDSHGLMILTNDGRITDKLLNPNGAHEKEYSIMTMNPLRPSFKEHMEKGVDIGDAVTKPCRVRVTGEKTFNITITEGRHHQIRRMCEAMHNDVKHLERVRIMNIRLGNLAPNAFRKIEGQELDTFFEAL
ncbi:MAG: pseudouridine synthase [bacterium]